ncbi:Panacea domain-containing protein [Oleispirillum naphthae]|uniref:Panacea domain-containing protein n=1 Tax=Oleispirillum naphthae TaxID=2838853 RepID=UPI0030824B4A
MPKTAVTSTFDVVIWLTDRALNDGEYLQPVKLHRLLYLAQAYFAAAYHGEKLMPATFIAEESGPVEPDVWRVYASGRPYIESVPPPERVAQFLDSVWRRFGAYSADYLTDLVAAQPPYLGALADGLRGEIPLAAMAAFYGRARSEAPATAAPAVDDVLRPRTMVSARGQAVTVRRWTPRPGKSPK